jgi:predicted nucleic acid-binding protein
MRALLDTSFFVATESGRPLGDMQGVEQVEISVVTVAELTLGVLMAEDADRAARLATLAVVESNWEPLPVDVEVARQFAAIVADLRTRGRRVPVLDALIAATAVSHGIPIVSQDRDFEEIRGVEVIRV